jgi:hypothetical protein
MGEDQKLAVSSEGLCPIAVEAHVVQDVYKEQVSFSLRLPLATMKMLFCKLNCHKRDPELEF